MIFRVGPVKRNTLYVLFKTERPNSKPGHNLDVAYVMTYVEGRALTRETSYMEGGKEILQMKSTLMMEEGNTIVMRTEKDSLIGGIKFVLSTAAQRV